MENIDVIIYLLLVSMMTKITYWWHVIATISQTFPINPSLDEKHCILIQIFHFIVKGSVDNTTGIGEIIFSQQTSYKSLSEAMIT